MGVQTNPCARDHNISIVHTIEHSIVFSRNDEHEFII